MLARLHDAGWDVVTTADPTASYGAERDVRVANRCDATFVREHAMEKYERLKPNALAALEDPEIARRASLSSRSQPPEERGGVSDPDPGEQASLTLFSASDADFDRD